MLRNLAVLFAFALVMGVSFSASAEEGEKGDPDAKHPDFEYIQLDPLTLPVITAKGLTQQISLKVQLEVPYGKRDDVAGYEPRLIDAYLRDLYGQLGAGRGMMKNNFVDVSAVKQRLTEITHEVMGEKKEDVHEVLLQVLLQRPM